MAGNPETAAARQLNLLRQERGIDPLAAAKAKAQRRALTDDKEQGPEWPKAEAVPLEIALTDLCIAQFDPGISISSGAMRDGMAVWVRIKYPVVAEDRRSGTVAFTVSDTLEKALRKAVQLLDEDSPKIWKEDRFAQSR